MAKRVGYSSRCKVCNHEGRDKIEAWINREGLTLEECEKKIMDTYGDKISKTTIWRHMQEHFLTKQEVKEAYKNKVFSQMRAEAEEEEPPAAQSNKEPDKIDLAYERSQLLKSQYIEENLSEIGKLDSMIDYDYAMYRKTVELMAEKMEKKLVPKPLADFIKTLNSNITTSMRTKAELLGTDAEGRKASVMETWIDLVESLND